MPDHHSHSPSIWVTRFAAGLRARSHVLDVACGGGRHTRWLLALGCHVTAVDIDLSGIADIVPSGNDAANLERRAHDLEAGGDWPLADATYDAVVVTNYLHRPILPALIAAIAPGGRLIYETFATGNAAFGRPRRPEFLLQSGELLTVCADLHVVAFEQGVVALPRPACIQRICAVRMPTAGPDPAPFPELPPGG